MHIHKRQEIRSQNSGDRIEQEDRRQKSAFYCFYWRFVLRHNRDFTRRKTVGTAGAEYPISNKEYPMSKGNSQKTGRQRLTAVSAVLSNMKRKIKDKSKKIKVFKKRNVCPLITRMNTNEYFAVNLI